jgi:rhodanese-related sulfurtransferase
MTTRTITPKDLHTAHQQGESIDLIDVRTPVEFREVHVEYARNIPLDAFDPRQVMSDRNGSSNRPLYVICRSGSRAAKACEKLSASGYENIVNVEGGTQAWEEAGLPVQRGKKAMSLERQVRIAAGFLVLTGVVLGFAVHPGFFGLSGIVGAGLMFAGITDTCAMGMLIAKMPWNQVTECKSK